MYCLRSGKNCSTDYLFFIEIALCCLRSPDAYTLVSQRDMKSIFIRLRIHRHSRYTHFLAGSYYSDRYLTSIGN